jgi:hypothetical protein
MVTRRIATKWSRLRSNLLLLHLTSRACRMSTLTALLGDLQTPDNDVRKAAEEHLESALGADPGQLLTELVRVAKDGANKDVSRSE